ncbi:MAG: chorismate synthase [Pseudoflavonifractor sp.]|nr:chorismate synthase [Alloprevotella sp.]MCM1116110.1 chorismate synthase [Pseudoflavonifractor sp.]
MSNTFGSILRLTTYGESHGPAIGGILDGMPPGIALDFEEIQRAMDRRRPGQSTITTARNEADRLEILSGLMDGVTTGTPIAFEVRNADHRSADYGNMAHTFRPSHADYTYTAKYGLRDHRGGGRSSARETLARVAAGAIADQALRQMGVTIYAFTRQVGPIALQEPYSAYDPALIETNAIRCPDPSIASEMISLIEDVKRQGDTIGGVIECVAKGCPAGWGEPVFDKLQARLAMAMMGINAAKGFEYGMGFKGAAERGSEMIDHFEIDPSTGAIGFKSNHSGGIQGGITNGADIYFRVAFKPVATLLMPVETITDAGEATTLQAKGRHDPCVVARAVPIVEAMTALTLLDAALAARCYNKTSQQTKA